MEKQNKTAHKSPLKIGDLESQVPLIQGGMGVGISLGNLAGAVAKAGAVGIISAAQIGYREPDFENNTVEANLRAIEKEYDKARKISPEGVIGFNIMVAMNHYKEYVKKVAEVGADLIISGAGLPTELPELVAGYEIKIAPIVSSEKAAQVLLKMWDRKYERTADLIVIEGPKAGGHLGFSEEEVQHLTWEMYKEEIRKIQQVVKGYEEKYHQQIPVVVAGGIFDADDVKRVMELGVEGVQVASRFVATEECDADILYKEAYVKCEKEDVILVKSPVGMPGRAMRNPFSDRIERGEKEKIQRCYGCLRKCDPSNIPYCITKALIRAVEGDVENGLIFCGAETYRTQRIETVQEVVDSLFQLEINENP